MPEKTAALPSVPIVAVRMRLRGLRKKEPLSTLSSKTFHPHRMHQEANTTSNQMHWLLQIWLLFVLSRLPPTLLSTYIAYDYVTESRKIQPWMCITTFLGRSKQSRTIVVEVL